MPSLHHATLSVVLTFAVIVSGCAGIVPGTQATPVDGQAVTVQSDAVDAMQSVESYRAVTNMDVAIGANRTFTNVTTVVNHSMAAAARYSSDTDATTYVVGDWRYRDTSDGWRNESGGVETVDYPAREQAVLLNESRVIGFQRTRTAGRLTYQLELAPENSTLAAILADQSGNGVESAGSVTVLDRSYEVVVNRTTHRVRRVEMTLKFRHDGDIGRATMVTWFGGYDRTVPNVPDRSLAVN